jgi:hypothetical protein
MAERCMVCNGSGKHAPMGGILVMCQNCNGAGYLTDEKKIAENRLKMQTNKDKATIPGVVHPTVMPVNVPVTPIIAPDSTISGDPLSVTTKEIETIKSRMLADNALHPSQMDKRTSAYKAWKATQE